MADTRPAYLRENLDSARVDQWLWSIRIYPTRSAAGLACRGGHVKVNGVTAKPATTVRVGDRVEATLGQRLRVAEVVHLITKRVGAQVAIECYVDHSPAPPEHEEPIFRRDPGMGRPTKRDRRKLDQLRGGSRQRPR
jgi:ribosome-associated heat shock protein Hsp15